MNVVKHLAYLLVMLVLLQLSAQCAVPSHYSVSPVIRSKAGEGGVYAVNSLGQVAGSFYEWQWDITQGFVWQNGVITRHLIPWHGYYAYAYDINDSGVVVGESYGRAVMWEDYEASVIPGLYNGMCRDINNNGDTALFNQDNCFIGHGNTVVRLSTGSPVSNWKGLYINDNGEAAGYGTSTGSTQSAYSYYWSRDYVRTQLPFERIIGLNDSSQVIGAIDSLNSQGVWQNGKVQWLGNFNACGISNQGLIFGTSYISGQSRAAIWDNGVVTNINTLVNAPAGVTFTQCQCISSVNHVVVLGSDNNYYLLTPEVPEPSGILAILSGFAVLVGTCKIRVR